MELRDKIQRGQEKLFQISIYVSLRADTLAELDKVTKLLETTIQPAYFIRRWHATNNLRLCINFA